jgi:cyanophycinase-like exopeptidase
MSVDSPDELLNTVLPPALEVLTAWSIAETEADPAVFRHAMNRAFSDAAGAQDPWRGFADMMFGLSSLSGILLDELADVTGRSRGEVLHAIHLRYLDPQARPPH